MLDKSLQERKALAKEIGEDHYDHAIRIKKEKNKKTTIVKILK